MTIQSGVTQTVLSTDDRRDLYGALSAARDLARGWPAGSQLREQAERVVQHLANVVGITAYDAEGVMVLRPGVTLDIYVALECHDAEVMDVRALDDGRQVARVMVDGRQRVWRLYEKLPGEVTAVRKARQAVERGDARL
jgi:hypothetical protein